MSQELLEIFGWISRGLLIVGALASTVFFLDYIRVANLKSSYSRMLLILNGAIATVLWTSLSRQWLDDSIWTYILTLVAFALVDIALISQTVLMYRARKRFSNGNGNGKK